MTASSSSARGLLHDLGKVGIPDSILLKQGRFTDQEFARMKAHPAIGDTILKNLDGLVRSVKLSGITMNAGMVRDTLTSSRGRRFRCQQESFAWRMPLMP